ncbi:hypothetical protein LVD17_23870 [Fulvivirga ulvae]|uniref:hypothetical protein n=1 Tax=Fulvivirga ulvae TaxID=2904245 RepID=UPI001F24CE46|nr:hypothetical protein [Fulvivirga ulvae]UII31334.1 hypothetical protein LVD17_23870 [Fulvivirga ulvae]
MSSALRAQDIVPFRSDSTYNFELDYNFKTKPAPPHGEISYTEYYDKSSDMLPYVSIKISLLGLSENDFRVKVVNNQGNQVYSRKMKLPMEFDVELGFAEDLKEKLVPHLYYVYFFDKERNLHSRITIEVTETGDFLLNDKIYGKL